MAYVNKMQNKRVNNNTDGKNGNNKMLNLLIVTCPRTIHLRLAALSSYLLDSLSMLQ